MLPRAGALDLFLRIPAGLLPAGCPSTYIETVERTWINNNDRDSYRRGFNAINSGADTSSDADPEAGYIVTDPASLPHLSPGTGGEPPCGALGVRVCAEGRRGPQRCAA